MADPRFFANAGPLELSEIARVAEAEVRGADDPHASFDDVAPLDKAGPRQVSFLDNRRYVGAFSQSKAGVCLVHPDLAGKAPEGMVLLVTEEPYHAYARVAAAFYPAIPANGAIAASARIDASAQVGEGVQVDDGAVIGAGAEIGARTIVGPNVVIGPGVRLGEDCRVGPNASVLCALVGDRVIVHGGVRIGQDGFGFAMGPQGHRKVPQLGRVVVGDDVEIGANTTIDRGTGPDTVIGAGSKLDNLVQIAHNVELGRCCVVVAQVGISGSTKVGDFAIIAGQAGLTGHLTIGPGARIAAQSGVMRNVEAGATVGGSPAMPMQEWLRQSAVLARMARKGKGK